MQGNFIWVNTAEGMLVKDLSGTVEILSTIIYFN